MKKALIFIMATALVAALVISAEADQWAFFEPSEKTSDSLDFSGKPFATVLSSNSDGTLEVFSGSGLASFVPIQLDQLVVSLVNVSREEDLLATDETPFFSEFNLNTGKIDWWAEYYDIKLTQALAKVS